MTNINQWIERKMEEQREHAIPPRWVKESLQEAINLGREDEAVKCDTHAQAEVQLMLKEILAEYYDPIKYRSDYTGPTKDLVEIIKSKLV